MIKIKTKKIKENDKEAFIGVSYKVKNTDNHEHLVVINHLLHKILETKMYSADELLTIIALYLGKEVK